MHFNVANGPDHYKQIQALRLFTHRCKDEESGIININLCQTRGDSLYSYNPIHHFNNTRLKFTLHMKKIHRNLNWKGRNQPNR